MMSLKSLATWTVPVALVSAGPASAQYMMHLDPNLYIVTAMLMTGGPNTCMTGAPPPDSEIEEARQPAPAVMQAYFDAAQTGGAMSNAFRKNDKSSWTHGGVTVPFEQIDAQRDPLAATGNRLDAEPLRFFRAGNFQTAQGQWAVLDAAGSVAGVYDATFRRQGSEWKLQELSVLEAGEAVTPAVQYCVKPGDVTPHKIESATNQIEALEKQVGKSEAKLQRDAERLAQAEAKLEAKPESSRQKESVARARATVENRESKLAEQREWLEKAQERLMKSNRDAAEIAAMTLPARDALQLRDFELTTDREAAEEKAAEEAKAAD